MRKLRSAVLLAAMALVTAPLHAQVNGGFETGDFTGWSLSGCGFTGIDAGSAHSGSFGAYTGTVGSTCTISQTIATTIGQQYSFSFWLSNDGGTPNSFSALWGGSSVLNLNNNPAMAFTLEQFAVTATTSSTTIAFTARQDPAFWHLDDVSVTSTVPEPSSVLLMGSGLLGLAVTAARRRRRA